jgi:signal transduction histidine kinase
MHTNLFASSGRPHLNIGEGELWDDVKSALRRVLKLVRLPMAAAYISSHLNYSALRRVVATRGKNATGTETITLPTFEEFAWLADQTYVILPRDDGHFAWLAPETLTGTPKAVLYGHEVTGGRLMTIAFGVDKGRVLAFEDLATLYESVAVQIFNYVDNAMFGIELDFLTSETGHLMGRAIGKVESGTRVLRRHLDSPEAVDRMSIGLARSAVEDGLTRLKLVHNNFYWFSAQRRFLDGTPGAQALGADQIDICALLRDMLAMFRREAADRGLKPTRLEYREREAIVSGPEDLLRLLFLNLYDNALKFAYAKTFIDIRLFREGHECVVTFENLGVGVAADEVKTVFERLRRSRFRDPSRRVEGLGLGLAYCRRVVEELFHGRISLASRPADLPKGERFEGDNWLTTVTVSLPLMSMEQNNPRPRVAGRRRA